MSSRRRPVISRRARNRWFVALGILAVLYAIFYYYGYHSGVSVPDQTPFSDGYATYGTAQCGSLVHPNPNPLPPGYQYAEMTCAQQFHAERQAAFLLSPVVLPFIVGGIIIGSILVGLLAAGILGAGNVVGSLTEINPGEW